MAQLKRLDKARILGGYYRPYVVKGLYQVAGGGKALEERLDEIFAEIDEAIANGKNFIVLSDRESNHTWGPIPVPAADFRRAAPPAAPPHPYADLRGRRGR